MIVALAGTHEQQFNRLVDYVETLADELKLGPADVFIQYGYMTKPPSVYPGALLVPKQELEALVGRADIVVTHGGPGTIMDVFMQNKIPVVIPRNPDFSEHVDGHQIKFARKMRDANRILLAENLEEFRRIITHYADEASQCALPGDRSAKNRASTCEMLEKIWNGMR